MKTDRSSMRTRIHQIYAREHDELGIEGALACLERARAWDLAPTLDAGGVVVFPHAGVADCGHQIAAAVHGCLDSGADRVLVISVLHAFSDEMEAARVRVANGGDLGQEPLRGIQGPGLQRGEAWRGDHALTSWRYFWKIETERRGIQGPEVIERYPYLAGAEPQSLPGFDEVARWAEDAVIVSTADAFHHGIGYGTPSDAAARPDKDGLALARRTLQEGIDLLEAGDYRGYNQHCVRARNDARDAGPLFRSLRGPMHGEILDLTYTDTSELINQPPPTWVAGALFEWRLTV